MPLGLRRKRYVVDREQVFQDLRTEVMLLQVDATATAILKKKKKPNNLMYVFLTTMILPEIPERWCRC
jgi:hypothetical protein